MIHLIQCLCPQRHAIFATAYDSEEMPDDVALAMMQVQIEKWVASKAINPWCGICNSRDWHYEQRRTKFTTTMEEAMPHLKKAEQDQLATRRLIDEQKAAKN